jgi:3-hydroxybutyryl-CoA dehydrogenase
MNAKDVKTIGIVGAGFIAPGVALVFAAKGFDVVIYARRPDALTGAVTSIKNSLTMMAQKGIFKEADIEPAINRIKTSSDLNAAVKGVQLVIECLSENMELKQKFFQDMDNICSPDTILASNTSVMSITEIASTSKKRNRIVGTHFWNPPYLIPLVEVTKAKDTSDEVMEITYQVMQNAGKHPVKCMKDVPGFIANRLQHALWREAISIVENGIADAATVDEAIKNGFAIRLPILGPLENADMVGLDLTLSIHDYIFKHLESSKTPSKLLTDNVKKGNLGFKTGQGFQKWTPEQVKQSRERLTAYLIEWTKNNRK